MNDRALKIGSVTGCVTHFEPEVQISIFSPRVIARERKPKKCVTTRHLNLNNPSQGSFRGFNPSQGNKAGRPWR